MAAQAVLLHRGEDAVAVIAVEDGAVGIEHRDAAAAERGMVAAGFVGLLDVAVDASAVSNSRVASQ